MKLSPEDLVALADVAITAATKAGEMVARSRPKIVEHKEGAATIASQVVTEIDRAAEEIIVSVLNPTLDRYELGLLTEETPDDGGRLTADYFWCIDPIDGTLPFIEGRPGYSISIALVRRDGVPQIGVVYDPVEATLYHAIAGGGVFLGRQPWVSGSEPNGEDLPVLVTAGFLKLDNYDALADGLNQIANDLGLPRARIEVGSGAVMKACEVLANPPACFLLYPGPTGASLWDFAATACLFAEAGAVATDIAGNPLELNRPDSTNMGHRGALFATDDTLAERVRALSIF